MRNLLTGAYAWLLIACAATVAAAGSPYGLCHSSIYCPETANDDCCRANSCGGDPWACEKNCCGCCDPWACESNCDFGCANSCNCDACEQRCDLPCLLCASLNRDECCCPRPCGYWSLFGGWSDIDAYRGESPVFPNPRQIGSFSDGWAIGFARGRRFKQVLRGELEFAFRSNSAAVWDLGGAVEDWDGDLHTYFGMANLYLDCTPCTWRGITPYLGAGIGFAVFDGKFDTATVRLEMDDAAFAYQGIFGLTKRYSRQLDGFVEYRFVGTTDVSLSRTSPGPQQEFGDYHGEFNNLLFGLRIWH